MKMCHYVLGLEGFREATLTASSGTGGSQRMARNESMKTVISHGINLHQIPNIKKYQNMGSVCDIYILYVYIYMYNWL